VEHARRNRCVSVVGQNYRLQNIQLARTPGSRVWTSRFTLFYKDCLGRFRLRSLRELPRDRPMNRLVSPKRQGAKAETPGSKFAGGHRIRVTPVPIPNTEVKPDTADGTAWETVWESRSLPALFTRGSIVERRLSLFYFRLQISGFRFQSFHFKLLTSNAH
jgi:hypothetical protein